MPRSSMLNPRRAASSGKSSSAAARGTRAPLSRAAGTRLSPRSRLSAKARMRRSSSQPPAFCVSSRRRAASASRFSQRRQKGEKTGGCAGRSVRRTRQARFGSGKTQSFCALLKILNKDFIKNSSLRCLHEQYTIKYLTDIVIFIKIFLRILKFFRRQK